MEREREGENSLQLFTYISIDVTSNPECQKKIAEVAMQPIPELVQYHRTFYRAPVCCERPPVRPALSDPMFKELVAQVNKSPNSGTLEAEEMWS